MNDKETLSYEAADKRSEAVQSVAEQCSPDAVQRMIARLGAQADQALYAEDGTSFWERCNMLKESIRDRLRREGNAFWDAWSPGDLEGYIQAYLVKRGQEYKELGCTGLRRILEH